MTTIYSKAGADAAISGAVAELAAGAYPVQQVTLAGNLAYALPVGAPIDQVIGVVFTQDGTGGYTVTYGGSPVTVDTTAGASTLVELHPVGAGHVPAYPPASPAAPKSTTPSAPRVPTAVVVADTGADPVVIDRIGSVFYGAISTTLYSSTDGQAWTLRRDFPGIGGITSVHRLASGELLLVDASGLYRTTGWVANPATATAARVLAPNGICTFLPWGVAVSGSLIAAVDYANSPRTDSRYLKVSTDGGTTWATRKDLNVDYPGQETLVHWHCVAWDAYHAATPRLWAGHGDGPRAILYSDDLGVTWATYTPTGPLPGVAADFQPTTMTPAPGGLVCGTDSEPAGVWLLDRATMQLSPTYRHHRGNTGSLYGIAQRGQVGTDGTIYIGFQSIIAGVPPIIVSVAADGRSAARFYQSAADPETGSWRNVVAVGPTVVASGTQGATRKTLVAATSTAAAISDTGALAGGQADANGAAVAAGASAGASSVAVGVESSALLTGFAGGRGATAANEGTSVGYGATTGASSVAVGHTATAGLTAVAIGKAANAGNATVAIGAASVSTGSAATAIGQGATTAAHANASAIGAGASVTGPSGTAIGKSATAASSSVAIGAAAGAGAASVVIAPGVVSVAPGMTVVGSAVTVGASEYATAVGYNASTSTYGTALGWTATAGYNSVALGRASSAANAGSVALGSSAATTADAQVAVGVRHFELTEVADPAAPAVNRARLYTRDNGAGKTQLCVRFATGAVQVIATEP